MGIRLASEFINEEIPREERLWKGVIVTALEDCLNTSDGKVEAYRKHEAHLWFLKNDRDFSEVCWMANIEPALVRNRYLELHKKQKIFFTPIQKLWISYRENYKVYRECKSKTTRALVKKNIERIKIKIESYQNDR